MTRQRASMVVGAVVALAAAVGVAVAASQSKSDESAAAPRPTVSSGPPQRVVLPGAPGDDATITDSDQVTPPGEPVYNRVDSTFVQMMIVHHGQAIEMANLAPQRASNAGLKALAERIAAAQAPEVAFLKSWLQQRRLPDSDPTHDHTQMAGMQSPADMTALAGLNGADFDRKFATMMADHHRGAMQMAGDVLTDGSDERLREVANEMAVEQGSEIRRMEQMGFKTS